MTHLEPEHVSQLYYMLYVVGSSVVASQSLQCNNGYSVDNPNQGPHTCNNNIDITTTLLHSDKYVYHYK